MMLRSLLRCDDTMRPASKRSAKRYCECVQLSLIPDLFVRHGGVPVMGEPDCEIEQTVQLLMDASAGIAHETARFFSDRE